ELDFAFFRIEGDQKQVVDRQQRPDQQDGAEQRRAGSSQQPPVPPPARPRGGSPRTLHNCTSLVCNLRISTITSGTSTGRADTIATMPSCGLTKSKTYRKPSVASTSVDLAGEPPETKYTVLKSPIVQIVEISVQTRYK